MQEKKEPGQDDMGEKKPWPADEPGKQGDIGKKGGSGDVDKGSQPGTEKKL